MVLDAGGQIIYANEAVAKIFATPLTEILQKRLLEVVRSAELSILIDEVRASGESREKEVRLLRPEEKALLGSANLLEKGQVAIVLRDISEIKKLENLRSEFAANVSHELKTPLTAIRGYVETLLGGALEDRAHNRSFVEKINKNVSALSALIEDLLELSSLEARRGLQPFATVDLDEETNRALETLAGEIANKNISISKQPASFAQKIQGDAGHIYRAIINLLDNAVKYSLAGGKVEISCRQADKGVEFSVRDFGKGIPLEHQARIFERFYRVDKARSRELGGTGLGLSIVKHIMEIHGGTVAVESEVGKGARFTLVFSA